MSTVYLKIKIKSLAEEARIIRKEESHYKQKRRMYMEKQGFEEKYKTSDTIFWSLRDHRRQPVGTESRVALLAYGYLRGRKYRQMETPPKKEGKCPNPLHTFNLSRLVDLVVKYGPIKDRDAVSTALTKWVKEE